MDPGNWATDIEAGSRYGYDLLFVILLCGLAAMLLQWLAMRLGLVTGRDLARLVRERYGRKTCIALWLLAELAIVATDIAEVLGSALAFNLLFRVPLWAGVLMTGMDTVIVLGLRGRGLRHVEAIVLGLVLTIAVCFAMQVAIVGVALGPLLRGAVPNASLLGEPHALYLAVGILGATVMPHNLYLHSSVVQTRVVRGVPAMRRAVRLATCDIVVSLLLATLVNAAILTLSASAFHDRGNTTIAEIEDAYRLLAPATGTPLATMLFGVALLAAGQSATFTGTIAGQVILEGFLDLRIPGWQRRLITRGLAIVPALGGVLWLGEHPVGRMLVLTQVVLSLQLPLAVWPLIRFTSSRELMGRFASGPVARGTAWSLLAVIAGANLWLVSRWIA
jgi:manganese transport protein